MYGNVVYQSTNERVPYSGIVLSQADIMQIAADVRALLQDSEGISELEELMAVEKTEFEIEKIREILAPEEEFPAWRVGEAIAEYHLGRYLDCEFPWPDGRSNKNPHSSSGGIDLVGFNFSGSTRFVFAEVKTSHHLAWPPSLVTGRSGMRVQLEGIRDGNDRRRWAIRYLGLNAINRSWANRFREASTSYLQNSDNFLLIGALIHVAEPKGDDLRGQSHRLAERCPRAMDIQLIAIYISASALRDLAGRSVKVETAA